MKTKNSDLWPGLTPEVRDSGLPVTQRMFRVKFGKSDWFWSQSIVFTNPFKTRMSLDLARGDPPRLALLPAGM